MQICDLLSSLKKLLIVQFVFKLSFEPGVNVIKLPFSVFRKTEKQMIKWP